MNIKNTPEFEETLAYHREMINYRKRENKDYSVLQSRLDKLINCNEEELEEIIKNNLILFSTLPLAKMLFTDSRFRKNMLDEMKNTKKIPFNLVEILGVEEFYKDIELVDIVFEIDPNFLTIYIGKAPDDIIEKYIDVIDLKTIDTFDWKKIFRQCSEITRKKLISDPTICELIYLKVTNSYDEDFFLNEENQIILWNNIKELVKTCEIAFQTNLINYFTNEDLKKEIVKEINLLEYIHMISFPEKLLKYMSEDDIFKLSISSKISLVRETLPFLTTEHQREILELRSDAIGKYWSYVLVKADPELRYEYFMKNLNHFPFLNAFELFKESNDPRIFKVIVDGLSNHKEINNSYNLFYKNDFVSLLTEEQQILLASKLTWPHSFKDLQQLYKIDLEDSIITRKIISNLLEVIDKPEIFDPSTSVIEFLSKHLSSEQMIRVIKKCNKEKLLSNIMDKTIYNYALQILNENPNYFKGIEGTALFELNSISNDELEVILKFFTEKQIIMLMSNMCNSLSRDFVKRYKEILIKNDYKVHTLSQFYIFEENEREEIIKNLPISNLIGLIAFGSDDYKKLACSFRKEELINYAGKINSVFNLSSYINFIRFLSLSERIDIYNLIKPDLLFSILEDVAKISSEDEDYLINIITSYDLIEISNITNFNYSRLKLNTLNKICNKLKDYSIINLYCDTKLGMLSGKVIEVLGNDITILGNPKCLKNYEKLIAHLNVDSRNYIEEQIDRLLNSLDIEDNLKNIIGNNPYKCKISFIYAYNNGYLNENKMDIFKELLNNDKYLLYNLDFRLLSNDIFSMGSHFIAKTSRYPEIVKELAWLFEFKSKKGSLCKKIVDELLEKESTMVFDSKIDIILNYLCNFNDLNIDNININTINVDSVIDYIIERNKSNNDILIDIHCDISDYYSERIKRCDDIINQSDNIETIRNAFYTRYFWLSNKEIDNFLIGYAFGYDDIVRECADSVVPIEYIDNINKIKSIEDINLLKEIYNNGFIEYTISDYMNIVGIMKEAYNKTFERECKNKQDNMLTTNTKININDKDIEVIEILDNFGLFVHSTDAYGNMTMLNNNYFDSWNNNTNTANHGICSCYITNKSFGVPPVNNRGVLFGFSNINSSSINLMAPYDLVTQNNGYNITSVRLPMYLRLDNTSDFTRHTHNEFSLERRNGNSDYPCTEPDCVIILSDMPDEVKENSLKAVEDFKKQGIELKVYYIDRVKLMHNEANKNNKIIKEYLQTKNINLIKDIINNYESLRCCSDFITDINVNEILNKYVIYELIKSLSIELLESNDLEQIKLFIEIMDNEHMKFKLIDETVGARAHMFDLLTPEIETNLELLRVKLNNGGISNEFGRKINT